ncbi:MAG: type II toxin-antitoxin system mRNA interferase toxin, RelE/StbE family [bacterium]
MIITTTNKFDKQFKKQDQRIKNEFRARIGIFIKDSGDRSLNIHRLSGKLKDLWSLNVTGDVRVIFDKSQKDVVILVEIGSHSELY